MHQNSEYSPQFRVPWIKLVCCLLVFMFMIILENPPIYAQQTDYHLPIVFQGKGMTVATLNYFTAQYQDTAVTLLWETTVEIDTAGFNLYRSTAPDGEYVQINDKLIGAQGDGLSGASYSFVDTTPGDNSFYYKLEDIDYYNVSTFHGPIFATNELSAANLNHQFYIPLVFYSSDLHYRLNGYRAIRIKR